MENLKSRRSDHARSLGGWGLFPLLLVVAALVGATPALALTNTSTALDIGGFENLTLDGLHEYSSGINIHDAGVLKVGATRSLTLRAPIVTIGGGMIDGNATSGAQNGADITIDCDYLVITGNTAIQANGCEGTAAAPNGTNGGSIYIRAAQTLDLTTGMVLAWGGRGYSAASPFAGGAGGNGGTVTLRSNYLPVGYDIDVRGGAGGNTTGEFAGNGGDGGSISISTAKFEDVLAGATLLADGRNGGNAYRPGDGGNGGTISFERISETGAPYLSAAAGAVGVGTVVPTPGVAGTISEFVGVDAQFDPYPMTVDGMIQDAAAGGGEMDRAWKWNSSPEGLPCVTYIAQDADSLHVSVRHNDDSPDVELYFDVNNSGGTNPQTDDLRLDASVQGTLREFHGNGSAWGPESAASGWTALVSRRYVAGRWVEDTEFEIPYAKLGITANQARTMGFSAGLRFGFVYAPMLTGAVWNNPSTWPDLHSYDNWTAFQNVAPGVSPGQWTGFAPATWTTDGTPDCSVRVSDPIGGLDVDTAEYRYSVTGGSSWSAWAPAACTGADGSKVLETITAAGVPFIASATANRIEFRIADVGRLTGTSPSFTVQCDPTAPSPWASLVPSAVVTNTLTPDCSIRIQDTVSGLVVSSAEYQYSTDGGSTWTPWAAATCSGTNGTTSQQTIAVDDVGFQNNSATSNRIRFRITNTAGGVATSAAYSVQFATPLTGLPSNGNFEVGLLGHVPSRFTRYAIDSTPGFPGMNGEWVWNAESTTAARYEGAQALYGKSRRAVASGNDHPTAVTEVTALSGEDFTGVSQIELYMRGIDVGEVDPLGGVSSSDCYIALTLSDGLNSSQVYLYRSLAGAVTDSKTGTSAGVDGQTWSRYAVSIPPTYDKTRIKVGVKWYSYGHCDGGFTYGVTDVHATSMVDLVRAVDTGAPSSSASVSGPRWSMASSRSVSYTAADSVALTSVELWSRSNIGAGFGPWTMAESRVVVGTTSSGTFTVPTVADGTYEFYTRARDNSTNYEAAPVGADTWCGVDSGPPGGFVNYLPADWANSRTPVGSVDVRDPLSGMGIAPSQANELADGTTTTRSRNLGEYLYTAEFRAIGAYSLALPAAPVRTGDSGHGSMVLDLSDDGSGAWLFAACGDEGIMPVSLEDPAAPKSLEPQVLVGSVVAMDGGLLGGAPRLLAGGSAAILSVWDSGRPDDRLRRVGEVEVQSPISAVAYDGTRYAYVGMTGGSVAVVDLQDETRPEVVDELTIGPAVTCLDVDSGRLILVADERLEAFDLRDGPQRIRSIGQSSLGSTPHEVRLVGNRAYVAETGLAEVFDVSFDGGVAVLWQLNPGNGATFSAEVVSGYLHTFNEDVGIRTFRIAEPAYQYSSDGGSTWSSWHAAACSVAEGSVETATLTAAEIVFAGDSESQNQVRFRTSDTLGNSVVGSARTVRVDTVAPGLVGITSTTHSNPASWYPATTVTAGWLGLADLSGQPGYAHVWDDSPATVPAAAVTTSALTLTRSEAAEGVHYLHVRAVDGAYNWGPSAHFTYRVDSVAPTAPVGLVASPSASTTNSFTVSWTAAAQPFAPLDASYYKIDAVPGSATDGTRVLGASASLSGLSGSGEGTHTVHVWLRDAAGNVNHANRASTTFVYDASAPSTPAISSSTHPVQATWYDSGAAALSWVSTDSVSAVTGYSWTFDQTPGTTPDTVADTTTPAATVARSADGVWYFHVRSCNARGLWGGTSTYVVRWDTAAPTGSMSVNSGSAATSQTAVTVDSSVSDVSPMTMRVSVDGGSTYGSSASYSASKGATLLGADGSKTVVAEYTDAAGHELSRSDTIVLDTAAPTGGFVINGGAAQTRSANITVTASVTDLTAVQMCYSADLGVSWTGWETYAADKTLTLSSVDGTRTVRARFRDAAGNQAEQSDTIVLDSLGPTVQVTSATHPVQASWYPTGAVDLSWTASDTVSGVSGYSYSLNQSVATPADTAAEGAGIGRSYAGLADGIWYFHLRGVDGAGNWGSDQYFAVRVDTGAPSLSLDAVASYTGVAVIHATASDPLSGVDSVEMQLDGGAWAAVNSVSASSVGAHTVAARVHDRAGNERLVSAAFTVLTPVRPVTRAGGANRYDVATGLTADYKPGLVGYTDVIVACGEDRAMADPLGASGLAGVWDAPILLTPSKKLNASTAGMITAIRNANGGRVNIHVIGGTTSMPKAIYNALSKLKGGGTIERIDGRDRYDVAAKMAARVAASGKAVPGVMIANIENPAAFYDALAASPISARAHLPIVGVRKNSVPSQASAVLGGALAGKPRYAVNSAYLSAGVMAGSTPMATSGDRITAATQIASFGTNPTRGWVSYKTIGLANKLPDALTGGALVGMKDGVMLYTNVSPLAPATAAFLPGIKAGVKEGIVLGGPVSVSEATVAQFRAAIAP